MGTIKDKYKVSKNSSLTYARPYTQRIDSLEIPASYQPPKFQQFDGRGSPNQHVAHFLETFINAERYGAYLVKQLDLSLKENSFG